MGAFAADPSKFVGAFAGGICGGICGGTFAGAFVAVCAGHVRGICDVGRQVWAHWSHPCESNDDEAELQVEHGQQS